MESHNPLPHELHDQAARLCQWLTAVENAAPTRYARGIFYGYSCAIDIARTHGALSQRQLNFLAARIDEAITVWADPPEHRSSAA